MIARLLILSNATEKTNQIGKILSEAKIANPHPDLLYFDSSQKLGIAEARIIKAHFSFKPNKARGKAVVLEEAGNLTVEAQNALLKTLEELPKEALFILATDSEVKLLPTVLSRCQFEFLSTNYQLPASRGEPTTNYFQDIERLLRISIEQRFEYIEKLKDREEFFHSLVRYFHHNLPSHISSGNTDFLKELLQAEEWAKQNVPIRAILEYLMLVMPSKS